MISVSVLSAGSWEWKLVHNRAVSLIDRNPTALPMAGGGKREYLFPVVFSDSVCGVREKESRERDREGRPEALIESYHPTTLPHPDQAPNPCTGRRAICHVQMKECFAKKNPGMRPCWCVLNECEKKVAHSQVADPSD